MKTWFQTTAIDYPNSRPHIGTAFEKLGADVQARYRRMEGYEVYFLMGNDENTLKVSKRAEELGLDPQVYCDDMTRQFREVWDALDITYDCFIQTSHERHKACCKKFIQKVYDNGFIYKGNYEGWFCAGCEEFKSDKQHEENQGLCPNHKTQLIRRAEPCWFFALSQFQERLLKYYEEHPDFIQPESRKNEIISLLKTEGLRDVNISRQGEEWGIRIPFDPEFTIYVWFDALLTYITGIGYGDDEGQFKKFWPADVHFIGKDITRFHCALWPAMLWAAGEETPKQIFAHGFVYRKNEESGAVEKIGKALGNVIEPMDIITKYNAEYFRYYFMRECPFPGDGEFSWTRFVDVCNSELANKLGNLYSRCVTLISKYFPGGFEKAFVNSNITKWKSERPADARKETWLPSLVDDMARCRYSEYLSKVILDFVTPTNVYLETKAPWKTAKTDPSMAKVDLFWATMELRVAAVLLKPFLPKTMEFLYKSFSFPVVWSDVKIETVFDYVEVENDLRVVAELIDGKPKVLFPRVELK